MTKDIDFNPSDTPTLKKIVTRWRDIQKTRSGSADPILHVTMDMQAANGVNGNPPLDLKGLLGFDDFNFIHDMAGISRHMNRTTGEIENFFVPRCATSGKVN